VCVCYVCYYKFELYFKILEVCVSVCYFIFLIPDREEHESKKILLI